MNWRRIFSAVTENRARQCVGKHQEIAAAEEGDKIRNACPIRNLPIYQSPICQCVDHLQPIRQRFRLFHGRFRQQQIVLLHRGVGLREEAPRRIVVGALAGVEAARSMESSFCLVRTRRSRTCAAVGVRPARARRHEALAVERARGGSGGVTTGVGCRRRRRSDRGARRRRWRCRRL